jgi:hypothetical protein
VGHSGPAGAWVVAWAYEPTTGGGSIATRTVGAASGALGEERVLYASDFENYPDIAYDSRRDRFLVISWHIAPGGVNDVWGRFADPTGAPVGEVIVVAGTPDFEGGDGVGVGYSAGADAYVAVFQSTTTEIWAVPVSGEGVPGTKIEATSTARMGSYAPRIAGDDAAPRWLAVSSHDFDRVVSQVLEGPAVEFPDAGPRPGVDASAGSDAGVSSDGGAGRDGGGGRSDAGRRPPTGASGGCSCAIPGGTRVGQQGSDPSWPAPLVLGGALLAVVISRCRRHTRRRRGLRVGARG